MRASWSNHFTWVKNKTVTGGGSVEQASEAFICSIRVSNFRFLLQCMFCIASLVLGFRISQEVSLIGSNFQQADDSFSQLGHSSFLPTAPGSRQSFINKNSTALSAFLVEESSFHSLPHPDARLPDLSSLTNSSGGSKSTGVYVGRHPILIRPWPHPDPTEMVQAYNLIARVQLEQHRLYGIRVWKPIIAITPTYARTFQAVHLTGLMHTLSLVRGPLTWIVIEAGGVSSDTASLLTQARVHKLVHLGHSKPMPPGLDDRRVMESHLRVEGLRFVQEQKMEGVIVFADDSNLYSIQFFDDIQNVKWVGALPVGMLGYAGFGDGDKSRTDLLEEKERRGAVRQSLVTQPDPSKIALQVQGPVCDLTGILKGWHKAHNFPLDGEVFEDNLEDQMLEWAGFVLNARAVWAPDTDRPHWIKGWTEWASPTDKYVELKSILRDENQVELLAKCGRRELVRSWWVRTEARSDSKFPLRWALDSPLEIVVPAKKTPWPDLVLEPASPLPPSHSPSGQTNKRKAGSKSSGRNGRSRHSRRRPKTSRNKMLDVPRRPL